MDGLTPIRRQYLDVKRRYPHAIVFFRLGDFYETFDDDAELCARELDLTLTSKPMGKGLRVPLAGIPYHAVEGYLAKLIAKGYKVAICDQTGDPATSKGLVERAVTRVVTPGTVVEASLLDERANNYLACLAPDRGRRGDPPWARGAGLAWVDISTGEFVAGAMAAEEAAGALARLRPAEVLLPDGIEPPAWLEPALNVTRCEPLWFDADLAEVTLQEQLRVASPEGFGLARGSPAVAACAAVLLYLRENQAAAAALITSVRADQPDAHVALDGHTLRNLEIFAAGRELRREGSLLDTLDLTRTTMGARLLRRRLAQPLRDVAAIEARLDAVAALRESASRRGRVAAALAAMPDLERLVARVVAQRAQPRELVALRRGLEAVPELRAAVEDDARTAGIAARLRPCADVAGAIAQAIDDEPGATLESGTSCGRASRRSWTRCG